MRHAAKAVVRPWPAFPRGLHLQVVAGREGAVAGTGNNANPEPIIGCEIVPDGLKLVTCFAVECVRDFWPIDGHDSYAVAILDLAIMPFVHGSASSRILKAFSLGSAP